MNLIWLLRAKRWVQNPPSMRQVRLVGIVVAICLAVVLVEWAGLWPASWQTNGKAGVHLQRP